MHLGRCLILVVEDDHNDQLLITRAFRKAGVTGEIRCVHGGNVAIQYLQGKAEYADRDAFPYPSFIITDLKMADGDGFELLDFLRKNPVYHVIPTAVLSASNDPDDVLLAYQMGASCYVQKPDSQQQLLDRIKLFYDFWNICEVPLIGAAGKQIRGSGSGQLGKRFLVSDEPTSG